jgi:hypothetical protein
LALPFRDAFFGAVELLLRLSSLIDIVGQASHSRIGAESIDKTELKLNCQRDEPGPPGLDVIGFVQKP